MNYERISVPKRFPLTTAQLEKLDDNTSIDDALGIPGGSNDLYRWFKDDAPDILKSCHALNAHLDRLEKLGPFEEWDPRTLQNEIWSLGSNSSVIDCRWDDGAPSIGNGIQGLDLDSAPAPYRDTANQFLKLLADGLSLYELVLADMKSALPKAEARAKARAEAERREARERLHLEIAQERQQHIERQLQLLQIREGNW